MDFGNFSTFAERFTELLVVVTLPILVAVLVIWRGGKTFPRKLTFVSVAVSMAVGSLLWIGLLITLIWFAIGYFGPLVDPDHSSTIWPSLQWLNNIPQVLGFVVSLLCLIALPAWLGKYWVSINHAVGVNKSLNADASDAGAG